MKTPYKGYTIVTDTKVTARGQWTVTLDVITPDGTPVAGLNLGAKLLFGSQTVAEMACVAVARYWIDEQEAGRSESRDG